jgi:hypothetical protein
MTIVRVWKHHPLNTIFAEVKRSTIYTGELMRVNLNEKRHITTVERYGAVGWAGNEFFEDCTLVAKTSIAYVNEHWSNEHVVHLAMRKIYGESMTIPKKLPKLKQPDIYSITRRW